jgi:hypothetical protein
MAHNITWEMEAIRLPCIQSDRCHHHSVPSVLTALRIFVSSNPNTTQTLTITQVSTPLVTTATNS